MMRQPQPQSERPFRLRDQHVRNLEIHLINCDCAACTPYVPSDPDRLTAADMGKLATLGALVGSAIIFAFDPAGAAAQLLLTIGF